MSYSFMTSVSILRLGDDIEEMKSVQRRAECNLSFTVKVGSRDH